MVANADDLGACPDLDAQPPRGRGKRLSDCPRAATGEDGLTGQSAVVAGGVCQQHLRRPWCQRAKGRVHDAAVGDGSAQRIRLEPLADQVGDGHGQDAQEVGRLGAGPGARPQPLLEPDERVAE